MFGWNQVWKHMFCESFGSHEPLIVFEFQWCAGGDLVMWREPGIVGGSYRQGVAPALFGLESGW